MWTHAEPLNHFWWWKESRPVPNLKAVSRDQFQHEMQDAKMPANLFYVSCFLLDVNLRKHTFNTRPTRELHHLAHPIPKQIPCAKAFQKKLQEVTEERALGPCLTQSFRLESSPWQGNGDLWIIRLILLDEWSLTWNLWGKNKQLQSTKFSKCRKWSYSTIQGGGEVVWCCLHRCVHAF